MEPVRGAPDHPQTQGKIERRHQTLKNRFLLENHSLPRALAAPIGASVDRYTHCRVRARLGHVTPADAYSAVPRPSWRREGEAGRKPSDSAACSTGASQRQSTIAEPSRPTWHPLSQDIRRRTPRHREWPCRVDRKRDRGSSRPGSPGLARIDTVALASLQSAAVREILAGVAKCPVWPNICPFSILCRFDPKQCDRLPWTREDSEC